MKTISILDKYSFFSALGVFILGLDLLAIILALLGFFYKIFFILYLTAGALFFLKFLTYKNIKNSLSEIGLSILVVITIIFILFSSSPTIFSGRDQGSFSQSAIQLAQNHKLTFESPASQEFFKIYGPGTALNFPGFNYTQEGKLITHFSLGYIAWLGAFYSLFNLNGLLIANGITFFLFVLSFFLLLKLISNQRSAWLGTILILSTFIFSWFLKFTLGENLALGLLWFALLEFILFLKFRNELFFLSTLSALFVLLFTRLETWALLVSFCSILAVARTQDKTIFSTIKKRSILTISLIFFLIYSINLFINKHFYIASLKGLIHSFTSNDTTKILFLDFIKRLIGIFEQYNLLIFLVLGAIGISYLAYRKRYFLLIPFFALSPILIYLVHPGISPDHPWMLRRFLFAIIPLSILYSTLVINFLFSRKIFFFPLMLLLVTSNLIFAFPFFTFTENKTLIAQTEKLSENFSSTDLILIDRLATGDGWTMLSGPLNFLFEKQAVYFFNPLDLEKINKDRFSNIYLIIPYENLDFYKNYSLQEKLIWQKDYAITREILQPIENNSINLNSSFPQKSTKITRGGIYLLKK